MIENSIRIYVLYNELDGITVKCTGLHLISWLIRGFEVVEIEYVDNHTNLLM